MLMMTLTLSPCVVGVVPVLVRFVLLGNVVVPVVVVVPAAVVVIGFVMVVAGIPPPDSRRFSGVEVVSVALALLSAAGLGRSLAGPALLSAGLSIGLTGVVGEAQPASRQLIRTILCEIFSFKVVPPMGASFTVVRCVRIDGLYEAK
jgi:hypothetical protein